LKIFLKFFSQCSSFDNFILGIFSFRTSEKKLFVARANASVNNLTFDGFFMTILQKIISAFKNVFILDIQNNFLMTQMKRILSRKRVNQARLVDEKNFMRWKIFCSIICDNLSKIIYLTNFL
jgi:hypothetical protein